MFLLEIVLLSVIAPSLQLCDSKKRIWLARESSFFYNLDVPRNLSTSITGVSALQLSWNFSCKPDVFHWFNIEVLNLNSTNTIPTIVSMVFGNRYSFTRSNNTSCDVYKFVVIAVGDSFMNRHSEPVMMNFPALPDVSPVEDSLVLSLMKFEDGVLLSFSFDVSYIIN